MKNKHLSQSETALLCRELALLYHAGVEPGSGLLLLAEDCADKQLKKVLEDVASRLDEGMPLSRALEESGSFPAYMCALIRIGEETGRSEDALQALADYYQYQLQLSRRLRAALSYPLVLMTVMLIVIVVLLTKVLPVFDSIYARLGGSMTGIAGILFKAGQLLDAAMPVLCVLLALVLGLIAALSLSDGFRRAVLSRAQKLWGDRGIFKKMNISRFAQAMSMGISSGLMMEDAIELAGGLLEGSAMAEKCIDCAEKMRDGRTLASAIADCDLLPAAQCRLLELGIKSGCTENVMRQIAEEMDEEADNALELALGRIEPAMVLLCSLLVGMILLSVMLPLLDIMAALG